MMLMILKIKIKINDAAECASDVDKMGVRSILYEARARARSALISLSLALSLSLSLSAAPTSRAHLFAFALSPQSESSLRGGE